MKKLTEKDYLVSTWSGGKTTQIAIAPEGAVYADRTFLWRLSSATVDLEESDFTALPDYDRLITPLDGSMRLTHSSMPGKEIVLAPYDIHAFDGADQTHSWGRCTDFNLMLRKGKCGGLMTPIRLKEAIDQPLEGNAAPYRKEEEKAVVSFVPGPSSEVLLLFAAEGVAKVCLIGEGDWQEEAALPGEALSQAKSEVLLAEKEALLLENEDLSSRKISLQGNGCLLAAEVWSK
ncbi:MAG: HutD family protein [Verrucomicrobia bacterium]|nr:HutD family protein [Verrucomicrobiota bacterium]